MTRRRWVLGIELLVGATPVTLLYLMYFFPAIGLTTALPESASFLLLALAFYAPSGWGLVALWYVGLRYASGVPVYERVSVHWIIGLVVGMGVAVALAIIFSTSWWDVSLVALMPLVPGLHVLYLVSRRNRSNDAVQTDASLRSRG